MSGSNPLPSFRFADAAWQGPTALVQGTTPHLAAIRPAALNPGANSVVFFDLNPTLQPGLFPRRRDRKTGAHHD